MTRDKRKSRAGSKPSKVPIEPVEIFDPFALRLSAYAMNRLHDPNWSGLDLYDHLKRFMRRRDSKLLFYETIADGLLWEIGCLAFKQLFEPEPVDQDKDVETAMWFSEDLLELMDHHRIPARVFRLGLGKLIRESNRAFDTDGDEYDRWLRRNAGIVFDVMEQSLYAHQEDLLALAPKYATNFAERMFHDRTLCRFVNERVFLSGIDGGLKESEGPRQWVERRIVPSWAKAAVVARDRGHCAICNIAVSLELLEDPHIDHMLPLKQGGTNDLSNLQLLCQACNLRKGSRAAPVRSSVPAYLRKGMTRRAD